MSDEHRHLLSTVPTRQTYLACPETVDPMYHAPVDSNSIHSSPSLDAQLSEDEDYLQQERRMSTVSSIETYNSEEQELAAKKQKYANDSLAYVQRLEKIFNYFSSSLYLENTVAVARDHLANERTYLAWVRTSLSTISIGVAITQLFRLDKDIFKDPQKADELAQIGKPLGLSFIMIGMMYMIFAVIRYFHSQVAMTKGYFPASRGIIIFGSIATLTALIAVFVVVLQI
ncbi:hypothetical protein INT47_005519 [Mucor saturninus]|uniref:DUF202 domain-containing protein n=1 Tax=Mucor saturninus TaxID=64648 RepID=A0A8H7V8A0_9FUNG|nr:hypothetical protein INT47_005519 [Mucor saturninus]